MLHLYLGRLKRKSVFRHLQIGKVQISRRAAQSDQGIHCPLTELLNTFECINATQMPRRDLARVQYESESMHFALARRHIFAWRGPVNPCKSEIFHGIISTAFKIATPLQIMKEVVSCVYLHMLTRVILKTLLLYTDMRI